MRQVREHDAAIVAPALERVQLGQRPIPLGKHRAMAMPQCIAAHVMAPPLGLAHCLVQIADELTENMEIALCRKHCDGGKLKYSERNLYVIID